MGIDIYARWTGQTEDEKDAQYTGFATDAGAVGYLREAYHGGPYATKVLLPETWDTGEARIPVATLRERLPEAIATAIERERIVYQEPDADETCPMARSLVAFVELIAEKEAAGLDPWILNSY